jgi:Mn-dependent DtxR family transcriptional regulator
MARFTPTQRRYLAFIQAYTSRRGFPPAESDIAAAFCVSPPSVNQMVKTLEKRGLILRHPGQPRVGGAAPRKKGTNRDARTTKLDDLELRLHRVFGYWFDFGDDWFHQVQLERIEQAIPTVTYPRVIKRVGQSPPQYCDE